MVPAEGPVSCQKNVGVLLHGLPVGGKVTPGSEVLVKMMLLPEQTAAALLVNIARGFCAILIGETEAVVEPAAFVAIIFAL